MDRPEDTPPEQALQGRCGFCGGELPAGTEVCPHCQREQAEGYLVRPRRPVWVKVLAYLILLMMAAGLVAWVFHLARRW